MISYLTHHCQSCAADSEVPFSASVFSQNQYCVKCGTTSIGISPQTTQPNMQDDLAALFSRNMNFSNNLQPEPVAPVATVQSEQAPTPEPEKKITYSITQHYHHSAHLAHSAPPSTSSTPARLQSNTDQVTAEIILSRNGVDPTSLFPSQLTLFRQADVSQQMRLVELWRISPPNYGGHALARELGDWPQTNLYQEQEMAKFRLARKMEQGEMNGEAQERLDILMHEQQLDMPNEVWANQSEASNQQGIVPMEGGDGRNMNYGNQHSIAEPYMLSGYESLAKREYEESARKQAETQLIKSSFSPLGSAVGGEWTPEMQLFQESKQYNQATDPIYGGPNFWRSTNASDQQAKQTNLQKEPFVNEDQFKSFMAQQRMEHQYSALEQMNHFRTPVGIMVGSNYGQDEEML